jgi:TPR repeat protein
MRRLFALATVLLLAAPACDDSAAPVPAEISDAERIAHAQFDLGKQYDFGYGVEQDYAEAAK